MKIKAKKGLALSTFMIGLFIFMLMASGFSMIIGEFNTQYPVYDTNITEDYDKISDLTDTTENIRGQTESNSTSIFDAVGFFTRGAYSVAILGMGSISMMENFFTSIAEEIGIPMPFVLVASGILVLSLVFVVVSAIFRWWL